MVERELREKSLEMTKAVISRFIEQGLISDREEAREKLSDREWVRDQGYLHIYQMLNSDLGSKALEEIFGVSEELLTGFPHSSG
ncbi:MAG: hypothetical protein AB7W16_17120 [Candidatus Obscuribacterales bacterium]